MVEMRMIVLELEVEVELALVVVRTNEILWLHPMNQPDPTLTVYRTIAWTPPPFVTDSIYSKIRDWNIVCTSARIVLEKSVLSDLFALVSHMCCLSTYAFPGNLAIRRKVTHLNITTMYISLLQKKNSL